MLLANFIYNSSFELKFDIGSPKFLLYQKFVLIKNYPRKVKRQSEHSEIFFIIRAVVLS